MPQLVSPLVAVEGLCVEFRTRRRTVQAVDALSFHIGPGETVAIVGESGSGKSVTALSIMRLVEREGGTITAGHIAFAREGAAPIDLRTCPEAELRRLRGSAISMIFQEPMTSLNPILTIGEQLAEVLMLHEGSTRRAGLAAARRVLDRVRIPDAQRRLKQYPHELSGGMRQRVMVGMALLCRPQLLIADEPTTALDVTIQAQVLSLIAELRREIGMAVLFITHDLGIVADIAERVVVMREGSKVEEADVVGLFATPAHAYTKLLVGALPKLGEAAGPAPPASADTGPVDPQPGETLPNPARPSQIRCRLIAHAGRKCQLRVGCQ